MGKIKVLLADDQELILESLHIVLSIEEEIGIVGLAKNGEKQFRAAISFCPIWY